MHGRYHAQKLSGRTKVRALICFCACCIAHACTDNRLNAQDHTNTGLPDRSLESDPPEVIVVSIPDELRHDRSPAVRLPLLKAAPDSMPLVIAAPSNPVREQFVVGARAVAELSDIHPYSELLESARIVDDPSSENAKVNLESAHDTMFISQQLLFDETAGTELPFDVQVSHPPQATPTEPLVVIADGRSAWLLFEDAALQEMIERVIRQNPTLREAQARITQSRAMFSRATADLFPQVSGTVQHGYRRFSQNGNAFVQNSTTTQGFDWYSSGFDSRWEIDLFGRLRGIRSAAGLEAQAAVHSYRDVMVTLIGDLMLSYVEFALASERINIANQNLAIQLEILELTKERLRIGEDGQLSVAQAQTQVELTRATIPGLKEQQSIALNRLLLLQGMGSQAFDVPYYWGQQLPKMPAGLPRSIDCELLARRPDVRSSRLMVAAQLERWGASRAEYYPQVFINGSISLETRDLDVWWDERSVAHNVGPTISLNLLDFGRIRSNITSEKSKYEQAVARYQQSILDATEEVRNAMAGVQRQRERAEGLSIAADTANSVVRMAKLEYKEGITNFQNVLDAQRQLLSIEDQRAVAQGTALISYARLYKALGGAWYESASETLPSPDQIHLPAIPE